MQNKVIALEFDECFAQRREARVSVQKDQDLVPRDDNI